jgi:murein peptide amidase A
MFNNQPTSSVYEAALKTIEPVEIISASIKPASIVYDIPSQITLLLNKTVTSAPGMKLVLMNEKRSKVAISPAYQDKKIVITLDKPLARDSVFRLSVPQVEAADTSYLSKPYVLSFSTSGGPKVAGVNIGGYKVSTAAIVVLTFDSPLAANQAFAKYISLKVGSSTFGATVTANGRSVTINPHNLLPKCTAITVKVLDGLKNSFGVSGGSAWTLKSRTICQTVFSIGTSVQGRSILAYRFGSGASKIIFVGGMHGNEKSSVYTLNSFIDALEQQYSRIPANRTIVVIPNVNPDGFAANTRTNANGVDLNRNFPADDWQSGVYMPGGAYSANGGGSAPLSEPEAEALANYTLSQSPRLVLTYHATAAAVIANGSDDSVSLAQLYGSKSGFSSYNTSAEDGIFGYPTTGEYEDWLHDQHGVPALLVELATMSSNQIRTQQAAMWAMVELP